MLPSLRAAPLRLALSFAALALLLSPGVGAASPADQSTGKVVRVEAPTGGTFSGAVTFTGIAVDCANGQAATRVLAYDGTEANGAYLADASIDTNRNTSGICSTATDTKAGFTLIYDSSRIADGQHTLTFVGQWPDGSTVTSASTTVQVTIANNTARTTSTTSTGYPRNTPYYGSNYGSSYGYGYGYGNPYAYCGYYPGQRADAPRAGCTVSYGSTPYTSYPYYGGYGYGQQYNPYCYATGNNPYPYQSTTYFNSGVYYNNQALNTAAYYSPYYNPYANAAAYNSAYCNSAYYGNSYYGSGYNPYYYGSAYYNPYVYTQYNNPYQNYGSGYYPYYGGGYYGGSYYPGCTYCLYPYGMNPYR